MNSQTRTEPSTEAGSPKLAPPGAGLPWLEALVIRFLGRRMLRRRLDWDGSLAAVAKISSRLAHEASEMNDASFTKRVLVGHFRGLEDSSRFWSPEMVLEHLIITGELFTGFVVALSRNEPIHEKRGIADVKPKGGLGRAVIDRFIAVHEAIPARLASEAGAFREGPTQAHPWFGKLNATDWLRLTAVHLELHARQWRAIRAGQRDA